jgi:hypothetical protein
MKHRRFKRILSRAIRFPENRPAEPGEKPVDNPEFYFKFNKNIPIREKGGEKKEAPLSRVFENGQAESFIRKA